MSSSVLRRYTPPTCTLEVAAIGSALSRWTDRAVLKNLRFELSFDDPTQNSDQQVTIRGDRNQLEALWEAVSGYVQNLLMQPGGLPLEPIDRLGAEAPDSISPLHDAGIKLQSQGWLAHELHLGNLANAESAIVPLTTLQLFDLANALDEYHAEALTLPSLGRPRWIKAVPNGWVQTAAAAVLVLGVSVPVVKFITDLSAPQVASNSALTKDVEISTAQRAGDLPTPSAPGRTPPPLTLTPLNPATSPPVGTTVFPAPVPGVATVPDTPPASVPIAPSPPTTIEIPTEQNFPAIPDNPPVAAAPSVAPPAAPPRLEGTDLDDLTASTAPSSSNAAPLDNELAAAGLSASNATPGAAARSASPAAPASGNQSEEVKSYFQQNWQPPEGLTETLEYRLLLNADGSLQRILPLGNASANFLDRTNMPLLGESFVSPTTDGKKPQIRVVLEPDGKVQTFLEYAD
jgi:Domain of unknown function (DUF4335)